MRPQRSSLIIRGLILSVLTLNSFSTFSQTNKVQVFNQYNDIFRVQNINFDHQVVSFSGSIKVNGKVIFEIREDEPGKPELYKAAFIPYDIEFFPYITDGYYPKKLIKIDLVNLNDAKKIIFSEQ
ncbi:hypothetical protein NBRC116188_10870 [Oceaniserpentilla sp. 4NH20-0058]|uniref:hypothetical protein n=1 Tax=Oceaniserpentilla sp. 4NH20-0058 TaxID=3127660 RepID=UPI00310AA2D2